jgi:3'-phosphoadenosine 5'-phosphosulfate sulfotransferase (PAPS reductase)/FAD synthetase
MNAPIHIDPAACDRPTLVELLTYRRIVVALSGGKDSVACVLHLLELGVPREMIELWHHDVDGREGSTLMDWPCTRAYCRAFAAALGIPIYFSWKVGGFEREMVRHRERTQPTAFEVPGGAVIRVGGKHGKVATRCQFPQVSPDLQVRWCSSFLKIDVCDRALMGQSRFGFGARTLVITGERAEESANRARYKTFEPHRADHRNAQRARSRRHIDHWRPVHGWSTAEVWAIIERHRINPHPCYRVGFGRASCMKCIFGSPDQWATVAKLDPAGFRKVAMFEALSGKTIKRKQSLPQLVERGTPYSYTPEDAAAALSETFDEPIILPPGEWRLPSGAFAESCGPT